MDAELIDKEDSQLPTEKPYEDLQSESSQQDQEIGSRTITWTFTCSGVKVDQEVYERLQSEVDWTERVDDEGCMIFRSKDADAIDSFSKKLTKIISEGREKSTTNSFTFTLTPEDR
jgi:hypothetical protein